MNTKIKVLLRLFLVTSFFTFSSCEKDLYEDAIQETNKPTIQKISLKDIAQSGTNKKLVEAVERIKNKRKIDHQTGKLVFNDKYGFYIDDENGKYIDEKGKETYTFQVYREYVTEKTENIIFKLNENNEYETYLSKYLLTPEQSEKLSKDEFVDLTNIQQEMESLDEPIDPNIFSRCNYWAVDHIESVEGGSIINWVWVPCTGGSTSGTGTSGTGTSGTGTSGTGTSGTGTSGTGTSGTGTSGTGTSGPSTGINNPTPGGLGTTPVVTPAVRFINQLNLQNREIFIGLMPESQQVIFNYISVSTNNQATVIFALEHINLQWLVEQSVETQINIFNYQAQNNFNSQSTNFVNQMISLSIANNSTFTFDNNINSQNGLVFNNVSEFQEYLNTNQNAIGNDFQILQQGNEKISSTKFEYPTYSIKAEIKQQITPTYNLISVNSYKTGITFMLTWDQTNFAPTYSGNTVTINLYGTITYGVKIGTFDGLSVTVDVHYQIVIDKTTGEIISATQLP